MSDSNHSAGVMGRDYAAGRTSKLYLNYRYRVRAQVAVNGYGHFHHLYGQPLNVLELGAAEGRTLVHMRSLLGGDRLRPPRVPDAGLEPLRERRLAPLLRS